MIIISILEKTFEEAKNLIEKLDEFASSFQIDVVDGKLVDGEATFLDINRLSEIDTKSELEIHLMVENPLDYMDNKIDGVTKICTQIEALNDDTEFILKAKELGYIVGLSVGPDTNYEQLEQYLEQIDYVQFMTIYPGAQGKPQIPEVALKIKKFHKEHPKFRLQVDGGVNISNIKNLVEAGADDIAVGSAILNDSNPNREYVELSDMAKDPKDKVSTINNTQKIQKIAFLGGAAWQPTDKTYKDAYAVAKVLAEAGYEIVNGGGPGVMRASTKGGHAGGGRVLAITYHPNKPKRHYEGVDEENDFDDEIITLDYFDRTKVMLITTQMHIVFKGSLGTLSEFGMTWISSWIHEPDNKPIILYGSFWKDYLSLIDKHALVGDEEKSMLKVCSSPEEVLEFVRSFE